MPASIKNNHFAAALIIITLTILAGSSFKKKEPTPPPNIVYILADDMGYGDLSILNKDSKITTPVMDKLAKEGIYFTDAHSNSAVCTPTRYGILTGRYAFRSSLKKGVLNGYSPALIETGRMTVASYLKANGYTTGCIGKWHLGLDWERKDATKPIRNNNTTDKANPDLEDNVNYNLAVKDGPADHGFDYSYIIPASLDMNPYCYVENNKAVTAPTVFTPGPKSERGVFWRAGNMAPGFDFFQVLPHFIDKSVAYINERGQKKKEPFFLYLPLPAPHTPWMPTKEFDKSSGAGKYGDYVQEVDQLIGKVVAALEKNGLRQNTLIIVTSDNGSDWKPEDIDATGHLSNYIFKGRKADIYEAGHRIPFIASWPAKIPAGSSSDQTLCTTDLLATVAGIIGKPLPATAGEDSYNMLDAFLHPGNKKQIREATVHHSIQGYFAIRKDNWKLTTSLGSGGFTKPDSIKAAPGEPTGTLYDLAKDPNEQVNLYSSHPAVVKELMALLEKYRQQGYSRPLR